MVKNDYHVIIYRILAYLYECLIKGKDIDRSYLDIDGSLFDSISYRYYVYIFENLLKDGLLTGVLIVKSFDGTGIKILPDINITPKGIEYLQENSMMSKAKDFLKTIKEVIPGL